MTPLFKKLNYKEQKEIYIINHPTEFDAELEAMSNFSAIKTNIEEAKNIEFALIFVKSKIEIEQAFTRKYKVEIG